MLEREQIEVSGEPERRRAEETLKFLAKASEVLNVSLDYEQTLTSLANLAVPNLADWCVVDILDAEGGAHRLATAHADPSKIELAHQLHQRYPMHPDNAHGAARVLRTGCAELIEWIPDELLAEVARDADHLRILRELGLASFLCVPLVARGQVIGALTLVTDASGRRFDRHDLALMEEIGWRAGTAIDNARLYYSAQMELRQRRQAQEELRVTNERLRVNIAERKQAEQALRDVNRELLERNQEMEQFVYTVSHDLKSPLVTAIGFVGLLKEDLAEGRMDDVQDSLQRLDRATRRMSELIDDLLHLSRIGRAPQQLSEVDVRALVHELKDELSDRLQDAGATLSIAEHMPPVQADRSRLVEVFEKLLNNAIKYGCQGSQSQIEVGAEQREGHWIYYVRDNGPGIEPQFHHKIFRLFQRLHSMQEGTGVGLAIVARVMQVHGGRAWVESQPGCGATFCLSFPTPEAERTQPVR